MRLNVDQIKRDAKKHGKSNHIDYQVALDEMARKNGFDNWLDLREAHRKQIAEDIENEPPTDPNAHLPLVEKQHAQPRVIWKKKRW